MKIIPDEQDVTGAFSGKPGATEALTIDFGSRLSEPQSGAVHDKFEVVQQSVVGEQLLRPP